MKKLVSIVSIAAMLTAGCATRTEKTVNADGSKTTVTTKQSDNAALSVVGNVVKVGGDIITAVLPPLVPVIVSGVTSAFSGSNTNAPVQ